VTPVYPFVPKSNAELAPGQFWSIPLSDGRFGCGRVLRVDRDRAYGARILFVGAVLDWVGETPPTSEAIAGAEVLAVGLRTLPGLIPPMDVAGFSMGGVVGAHLAAHAPELVKRLIVVGAGGLDAPLVRGSWSSIRGLAGEDLVRATRGNLRHMLDAPADDLAVLIQMTNAPRGRVRGGDVVLPDQLQRLLPRLASPVDAIWGERDSMHPRPDLQIEAIRRGRPEAELRVIPDAGHWAMYEQPEAFGLALRDLLARP